MPNTSVLLAFRSEGAKSYPILERFYVTLRVATIALRGVFTVVQFLLVFYRAQHRVELRRERRRSRIGPLLWRVQRSRTARSPLSRARAAHRRAERAGRAAHRSSRSRNQEPQAPTRASRRFDYFCKFYSTCMSTSSIDLIILCLSSQTLAEKDGLQMSLNESQRLYCTTLEQVTSLQRSIDGSNQKFAQQEEEKSEV